MAKKKVVKIDTDKIDINLEKDGTNIKLDVDTKNVDIHLLNSELKREFKLDTKNVDIEIEKTPEGVEVKVDAKGALWKIIAKRVIKFALNKFKR